MAKFTRKNNHERKLDAKRREDKNVTAKQKINNNKGGNEKTPEQLQNKTLSKFKKGDFNFRVPQRHTLLQKVPCWVEHSLLYASARRGQTNEREREREREAKRKRKKGRDVCTINLTVGKGTRFVSPEQGRLWLMLQPQHASGRIIGH